MRGGTLFYAALDMQRRRDRRGLTAEAASQSLITFCRSATRRSGRRVSRKTAADDQGLHRMARTSIERQEEAEAQMKRVRAALYGRAGGGKMDMVFPGDDVPRAVQGDKAQ